jgi:hypothetical protein
MQFGQTRWFGASIHHRERNAASMQMARAGQASDAQAYHDPVYATRYHILCHCCYHLSLT